MEAALHTCIGETTGFIMQNLVQVEYRNEIMSEQELKRVRAQQQQERVQESALHCL